MKSKILAALLLGFTLFSLSTPAEARWVYRCKWVPAHYHHGHWRPAHRVCYWKHVRHHCWWRNGHRVCS